MSHLNDNDLAVLELLVVKPRDYFPPLALRVARKLCRYGLAVCDKGEWFVTAKGVRQVRMQLH